MIEETAIFPFLPLLYLSELFFQERLLMAPVVEYNVVKS